MLISILFPEYRVHNYIFFLLSQRIYSCQICEDSVYIIFVKFLHSCILTPGQPLKLQITHINRQKIPLSYGTQKQNFLADSQNLYDRYSIRVVGKRKQHKQAVHILFSKLLDSYKFNDNKQDFHDR